MSIATKRGDGGQTGLAGGIRVSKAELRVEAYGTLDELNAALGFARSICNQAAIAASVNDIQKTLFRVGSALATPPESSKAPPKLAPDDVDRLTKQVHAIESRDGILSDWSLPGGHPESAAFEIARTVCRRAERAIVRLQESGAVVHPQTIPYVNRLSDLIWLFARQIELEYGVNSRLRSEQDKGTRWSRAW
ncbi:MAG TPA: cob(I)yrinic acid a,c-diamide adenosyltransferase [Terracidiphilus sp.]|nr:cob(I)yrinic acid a,c-diamide adenosyltransferase [Terracidiphilus sp.]